MNCIVLAGSKGKSSDSLGVNKAMVEINGRPMIQYVIEVLLSIPSIESIVIVGEKEPMAFLVKEQVKGIIQATGDMIGNVIEGEKFFNDNKNILLVSSDIPMITREAILDFIDKSKEYSVDLCYPIIERSTCENKYPGVKRTYLKLKEGTFTGGNIFYVTARAVRECARNFDEFIARRKKPLQMVRILGITFLIKLLLGILTIEELERRAEKVVKLTGKAIITEFAEIGTDVDKDSDLEIARRELK